MSYPIGVDLGATFTAAAVCTPGHVEVAPLGAHAAFVPTVVAVAPDGSFSFGDDAVALGGSDRVARQFIRRVGDDTPLLLGDVSVTAEALAARLVAFVVDAVAARSDGPRPPTVITHPASWGAYRVAALSSALSEEGLGAAVLMSGARASARAYANRTPVAPGDLVAVYDLGGSALDAAVLRRSADGEFVPVGRAEEAEVGGLDFDEFVFDHVRTALGERWGALDGTDPAVLAGVARLRRACTAAKERLSTDTEAWIHVAIPGIDVGSGGAVRLVRAELEEMIQPAVEGTGAALLRAITSAGAEPDDLAAVVLTGGSARIPLVTQVVSEVLGRPVTVAEPTKTDTVIGAALTAAALTATTADALAGADTAGENAEEPTQILLYLSAPRHPVDRRVPADPAEDEASLTDRSASPPAPPPVAVSAAPGPPVRRRRRRYAPAGLLAGGGLGLAALLAGGWMWMANVNGPGGADAKPNNPVADRTIPPASATPAPSPTPRKPAQRAKPAKKVRPTDTARARPSKGSSSPTRSPTRAPSSPASSGTPAPQPTPTTTAPSPSPSPSPAQTGSSMLSLLPIPSLLE